MESKHLLVDGSSLLYASQSTTKLSYAGVQTQGLFHFLSSLRTSHSAHKGYKHAVLWDGHAQWRYDIFPGYKDRTSKAGSQMEEIRAGVREIRPALLEALYHLGVWQLHSAELEADDLAAIMVKALGDNPMILLTGDQDWVQLITDKVIWKDHRTNEIITLKNLEAKTGYKTPVAFLEGKALRGDSSDKIPGVGGFGKKGAKELLAQFETVSDFVEAAQDGRKLSAAERRLVHNEVNPKTGVPVYEAYLRNMSLMDLGYQPSGFKVNAWKPELNQQKFAELAEKYGLISILRDLDSWLQPFKENLQ